MYYSKTIYFLYLCKCLQAAARVTSLIHTSDIARGLGFQVGLNHHCKKKKLANIIQQISIFKQFVIIRSFINTRKGITFNCIELLTMISPFSVSFPFLTQSFCWIYYNHTTLLLLFILRNGIE